VNDKQHCLLSVQILLPFFASNHTSAIGDSGLIDAPFQRAILAATTAILGA
jgi:hypothetical protein